MKKNYFSLVVFFLSISLWSQNYKNVMYYGDWSVWGGQGNFYPKDLPADLITHLNFAFIDFDSSGNLFMCDYDAAFKGKLGESFLGYDDPNSGIIPAFIALKAKNPNLKVGISLGGWSKSGDFSVVAANATARANFISQVMTFIKKTDMDFVDVDWEYPTAVRTADLLDNKNDEGTPNSTPADKDNVLVLMTEFRTALNTLGTQTGKTYELSLAVHGTGAGIERHMNIKSISNQVDFINLMTYDLTGSYDDHTGHQSPLYSNPDAFRPYSIDEVVTYCIGKGVPSNKLVIGACFYTRGWDSVDAGSNSNLPGLFMPAAATSANADGSASRGADNDTATAVGDSGYKMGLWAYRNISTLKTNIPDLTEYWDDVAKASYLYSASSKDFYTFDSTRSLGEKTNYVKNKSLGGVISWMASQDAVLPSTTKRGVLTKAIKDGLFGATNNLPAISSPANMKVENVSLANSSAKADNGKDAIRLTITNNEVLGTYVGNALKGIDNFYTTIKMPTIIITMKDNSTLSGNWEAGTVSTSGTKTIFNLAFQYNNKYIKSGFSTSFTIFRNDATPIAWSQIQKIEMEQYYDNARSVRLSTQVLYDASTLSTNNIENTDNLMVYPTQVLAGEKINISKKSNVQLINMNGQVIAKYDNATSVKAPNTTGVYLLRINNDSKLITKKIIVK